MDRLDLAIDKLENGTEVQDVIHAIEVLALEVHDLKETHYVGTQVPARS